MDEQKLIDMVEEYQSQGRPLPVADLIDFIAPGRSQVDIDRTDKRGARLRARIVSELEEAEMIIESMGGIPTGTEYVFPKEPTY